MEKKIEFVELENKIKLILLDCNKSIRYLLEHIEHIEMSSDNVVSAYNVRKNGDFKSLITLVYLLGLNKLHKTNVTLGGILQLVDKKVLNIDELDKTISSMIYVSQLREF